MRAIGQRLVNAHRLPTDGDPGVDLLVGQRIEGLHQDAPPCVPCLQQRLSPDRALVELLVPMTPGLLAVAGEKVGEPGSEVAGDMPADDRDGIAAAESVTHKSASSTWAIAASARALYRRYSPRNDSMMLAMVPPPFLVWSPCAATRVVV